MARRRFLVALVPPPRLLHQLRGLRAALGGPAVERIVPHVTLVPPFNVPDGGDSQVRRDLRAAVTDAAPIEVVLGPAASFAPANPTLHLAVGGDLAGLGRLRERVRAVAPGRRDRHPFVPHLTLLRDASAAVTDAAPQVLRGTMARWTVDRVELLEQVHDGGETRWRPAAQEPLGGPVVVGRGGVELHLRTTRFAEPLSGADGVPHVPDTGCAEPLVVLAEPPRSPGEVVALVAGAVEGSVATLAAVEVAEPHRRIGVGRAVLARWCSEAATLGAGTVLVEGVAAGPPELAELLAASGFSAVGDLHLRRLRGPTG